MWHAIKSLLIGSSIAIAVLMAIELVLWFVPLPVPLHSEFEKGFVAEDWGYRPAGNMRSVNKLKTQTKTMTFDDDGYAFSKPAAGSEEKILFIGDSFTQGTEEASFVRDFHRMFRTNGVEEGVPAVIGGGVGGYNGWQVYNWYLEYGAKLMPDVVIYGFFFNDVMGYFDSKKWRVSESKPGIIISHPGADDVRYWNGVYVSQPFGLIRFIRKNSRLLKLALHYIRAPQAYGLALRDGWVVEDPPALSGQEKEALELIQDHLRDIKERQAQHGGKLVVLLIPDGSEVAVPEITPRYFREMQLFCQAAGLHCINPISSLRAARQAGQKVYWNFVEDGDAHCTPAGYRIIANEVFDHYRRSDGFTSPPAEGNPRRSPRTEALSWMPRFQDYGEPNLTTSEPSIHVEVGESPAGVMTALPLSAGQTARMRLSLLVDGPLSVRFKDGEDLKYFSGREGVTTYIIEPQNDAPEILLYADDPTSFAIKDISLIIEE